MYTKLSQHNFKKGKFISPLNDIPNMKSLNDYETWFYGRLPEYLWIGLILNKLGRKEGLKSIYNIITKLREIAPEMQYPKLSSILMLDDMKQTDLFTTINAQVAKGILSPLTLIFTVSEHPVFASAFYDNVSVADRQNELIKAMNPIMGHQTNEATDIRFICLWFNVISGGLKLPKAMIEELAKYPRLNHDSEEMRIIRPMIRSCELSLGAISNFTQEEVPNKDFIDKFWRCVSSMTDCDLRAIKFPIEENDISLYKEYLYEIVAYLNELYKNSNPLEEKMSVILGIVTYSYKRFMEVCDYKLYNSISGRGSVRVLIENYIMIKYLLNHESSHENIWRDYKLYGTGLYKLVLTKHRENGIRDSSHFDVPYIEALVSEFWIEDSIDMDTKYFDKHNIRKKAEDVDEKELYGLYYDYDSSYEHGLWGAIRESSLLKCINPSHQYHCVPDIDNKNVLKSVLPDCILVMNKTIKLLDDLYGVPENLLNEVVNFEI